MDFDSKIYIAMYYATQITVIDLKPLFFGMILAAIL